MTITEDKIKQALAKGEKDPRKTKEAEHLDSAVDIDLFRKMRMGIDQWHTIDLLGNENPQDFIFMRILSIGEVMDVEREALQWFASLNPMEQTISLLEKKKAILTIKKALSSGKSGGDDHKYFANDDTIERLSFDGIKLLLNKYEEINMKYNANLDNLTDSEYYQYLEELKKKLDLVRDLSRPRLEAIFKRFFLDAISLKDNIHTLFSLGDT
jgi:hypothetical protein